MRLCDLPSRPAQHITAFGQARVPLGKVVDIYWKGKGWSQTLPTHKFRLGSARAKNTLIFKMFVHTVSAQRSAGSIIR
jgi:hypothetical protein